MIRLKRSKENGTKENKTLAQKLVTLAVIALIMPMTFLVIFNQTRIWRIVYHTLETDMQNEIEMGNMVLDMILDKYSVVLYDFCTDDDTVRLVDNINERQDELDVNRNQLRRKLSHLCNRNDGVEGITLVTRNGRCFFYDRGASSFVSTDWADRVDVPHVKRGNLYRGGVRVTLEESGDSYLIQIARRIVDYGNIDREIGTVILSINQDVLWKAIQLKKSSLPFICDGDRIIAAQDHSMILKDVSEVDTRGRKVQSMENETSGWILYDYYSTAEYQKAMLNHSLTWVMYSGCLIVFISLILRWAVKPLLDKVNELVGAMNRVEEGDFTVQVAPDQKLPQEVAHIVDGFNDMVVEAGALLEQVRISTVEQKNAELSAMEAQIDPHFLYNTLDTINWKAIEHGEYEISGMVGALADILRYSIRNPGDTVSIKQELYWLEQYIMLQKEKLEHSLDVHVDVPDSMGGYRIHKLLLQPFLENAINHGFYSKQGECILKIRMRLTEDQIHIVIQDNGRGIAPDLLKRLNDQENEMKGHVGVSNVRKRLSLYYGENQDIYFESREGAGTTVHLFIPAVYGEGGAS